MRHEVVQQCHRSSIATATLLQPTAAEHTTSALYTSLQALLLEKSRWYPLFMTRDSW